MRLCLTLLLLLASAPAPFARAWFVRAGSEGGDGSQARPFSDPWQALEKCEKDDTVHVAAGKYFGKLGEGTWVVPFDGVRLVGGFNKDFTERDPWTHKTELLWDKTSKNWPKDERLTSNAKNIVVDGITIDMKDQIQYSDAKNTGRVDKPCPTAMRFTQPAIVRNCVIVNPGFHGIDCVPGSTIENNLILNAMDWGVNVTTDTGDFKKMVATIRNNTILFSWCDRAPGKGRYSGAAIALRGPANITNNILAHCDNNAIYQTYVAERVSITKNVFHMNLWSNLKFFIEGRDVVVDNKTMDLLEEVGLKAFDGNEVADPGLDIDTDWLDLYSQRTSGQPGKVEMDDWNKLRQLKGLPLIGKGATAATGVAPAWDLEKALKLLEPKNDKLKAGARRVKLDAKIEGGTAAGPAKEYAKGDLLAWARTPDTVHEKAMEMIVAIGGGANIGSMPDSYKKDEICGFFLYDTEGKGERITGFLMKGSNNERVCNDATGKYQGQGKPDRLFVAKGIAYAVKGVPKAAFFIESIERYEPAAATALKRPAGRDWFVRAGASGGNGSKEKPFKDPFQALERCEAGDFIHVAEGEYVGKLRIGTWKIDTSFISLIGGYDKDFKERNPWTHPTLLYCPEDFKGRRGGYTIEGGQDDHTGAVVDGFVFDKKFNNKYLANGDCDAVKSDTTEHIWFARADCIVRNCVFVNGAGGALRVSNGQIIENNIFINHYSQTVNVQTGFTPAPIVIRNNSALFSWDVKFGEGHGRNGHFVRLWTDVRAVIDNNIFEFADNDAIQIGCDPKEVDLTNNVFAHNLWSAVQKLQGWIVVDEKNWKQLADIGFRKCEGNQLLTPGLPVDEKWFDTYLGRTAAVPGKVEMDDWNKLRELMGQPLIAKGGKMTEGFMPAYDWKKALTLFPKNAQCKAGARAANQPVSFTGIERKEAEHEYAETTWDVAKNKDEWEKLKDKRVMLKVAIRSVDNQWFLDDIKKEEWNCFTVGGPEGSDSGGLPLRCYVKKGTRHERAMKNSKGYTSGKPEETHILKGIARTNRQLVVEVIEKE